jgi:phosphatidylinositol alpha-1,6-mannosyltransferase
VNRRWWEVPWPVLWAGYAAAAVVLAAVTDLGPHRLWGRCAAGGYGAAALLAAAPQAAPRRAAPWAAVAGAVLVPLVWLVAHRQGQLEVDVVQRSGALLLRTGSPYLPEPARVEDYNPYLPGMALFGLPYALFGDGPPADARWGFALVFCLALVVAARISGKAKALREISPGHPGVPRALAVLAACPILALPLATGGIDLPVTALVCLALAAAAGGRPALTGLAAGAAAAMKWTAWPALVIALVLLGTCQGRRAARRAGLVATGVIATVTVPSVLVAPGAFTEHVLRFPLGAGKVASPAASPLPGHLLATLVPGGRTAALTLLVLAAAVVAASLIRRPPRTLRAAADRLALALALAVCLAPATRFGYLLMPLTLAVWFRPPATGPARVPAPKAPTTASPVPHAPEAD